MEEGAGAGRKASAARRDLTRYSCVLLSLRLIDCQINRQPKMVDPFVKTRCKDGSRFKYKMFN